VLPTNSSFLRILARVLGSFLVLASLHQRILHAQEAKLIDLPVPKLETLEDVHSFAHLATAANFMVEPDLIATPTPKLQSPKRFRHSRFALDRPAALLGLAQGASELYDGFTTKYFLHHCSTCSEVDPVSHFLLGSKPAWRGMLAAGSLEVIATTYLHQSMRRSPHKFVRRCAPLSPLLLTGIHLIEGSRNLALKNLFYCTTPGYVVVGSVCILPPRVQTGSSASPMSGPSPGATKMTFLRF
jgi:hypothetical protein